MPGKSSQTSLLGMFMPEHLRSPRRKRPLGLPGTLEMRYFPPQLGVIRGMSVYMKYAIMRTLDCFYAIDVIQPQMQNIMLNLGCGSLN